MPDREVGEILADYYSGAEISDDDKAVLKAKAAERLNAWTSKMYDRVAMMRSRQPGILWKSGAASLLHPLQKVGATSLRDDD